jgi:hypothetical protein
VQQQHWIGSEQRLEFADEQVTLVPRDQLPGARDYGDIADTSTLKRQRHAADLSKLD